MRRNINVKQEISLIGKVRWDEKVQRGGKKKTAIIPLKTHENPLNLMRYGALNALNSVSFGRAENKGKL